MNLGEKIHIRLNNNSSTFSAPGLGNHLLLWAVCRVLELQRVHGKHFCLQFSISGIIDGPLFHVPTLLAFFLDYWFPRATFKLVYWLICYDTFVLSFSVCCVSHSLPWNSIFAPCAESTDLAVAHLFLSCPVYYLCCMFSLYVCYKYFRVLVLF